MAILPHNEPDAGSDDPAVDLKRTLLTNVSNFKSVSKTNAWIDGMFALREDAEEADAIGFCSRIFPSCLCLIAILGFMGRLPGSVKTAPCACN